ncbi:MAG: DUF2249 domain-containing protein [Elusimicrobia bacterium]|nr:DUF2249 domain-containing protein [Elusimicrobiota bacterium]
MSEKKEEGRTIHLDVNGLEPPEPMVRILEAASALGSGDALVVEHFREPVPLYAHLEAAGFTHEIARLSESRWRLTVRRGR